VSELHELVDNAVTETAKELRSALAASPDLSSPEAMRALNRVALAQDAWASLRRVAACLQELREVSK
jgi:hypothetical protein